MKKIVYFVVIVILLSSCTQPRKTASKISTLSISSDGKYIISTHHGRYAVLWDIEKKSKKIISTDANIYSAKFIPNSNSFIWQDIKNNTLHQQDINGLNKISTDIPYASYGHIKTKDNYILSTDKWQLHQFKNNQDKLIKDGKSGFSSNGEILSMSIDDNEQYLLTAGECTFKGETLPLSSGLMAKDYNKNIPEFLNNSLLRGVVLWNLKTGKPLRKFTGNIYKTHATISPDGKYIVSGDENSFAFVWQIDSYKKLFELDRLFYGKDLGICDDGTHCKWDNKGLIKVPKDFCDNNTTSYCSNSEHIIAMKFINNKQYLRFTPKIKYAVLYNVLNPQPIKYLKLKGKPQINGTSSVSVIDTAPKAGILVISSAVNSGLIVYKYNKDKQTLKRIWQDDGPPKHGRFNSGLILQYSGNKFNDYILKVKGAFNSMLHKKALYSHQR